MSTIDILQNVGVCEILLYLLAHPDGAQKIDFRDKNELGLGAKTAQNAHKLLFKSQLITNLPSLRGSIYGLTEKGKKLAFLLVLIRDLLDNSLTLLKEHDILIDFLQKELDRRRPVSVNRKGS